MCLVGNHQSTAREFVHMSIHRNHKKINFAFSMKLSCLANGVIELVPVSKAFDPVLSK
jgi:hypothetical protein